MIRLTESEDMHIRNNLDHIGSNLYHNIVTYEDGCYMHKTIKDLLFIVDELQRELRVSGRST